MAYEPAVVRGILAMPLALREHVANHIIATVDPYARWSSTREALAGLRQNQWTVAHRFRMQKR
jgi:hypothetical protein